MDKAFIKCHWNKIGNVESFNFSVCTKDKLIQLPLTKQYILIKKKKKEEGGEVFREQYSLH